MTDSASKQTIGQTFTRQNVDESAQLAKYRRHGDSFLRHDAAIDSGNEEAPHLVKRYGAQAD